MHTHSLLKSKARANPLFREMAVVAAPTNYLQSVQDTLAAAATAGVSFGDIFKSNTYAEVADKLREAASNVNDTRFSRAIDRVVKATSPILLIELWKAGGVSSKLAVVGLVGMVTHIFAVADELERAADAGSAHSGVPPMLTANDHLAQYSGLSDVDKAVYLHCTYGEEAASFMLSFEKAVESVGLHIEDTSGTVLPPVVGNTIAKPIVWIAGRLDKAGARNVTIITQGLLWLSGRYGSRGVFSINTLVVSFMLMAYFRLLDAIVAWASNRSLSGVIAKLFGGTTFIKAIDTLYNASTKLSDKRWAIYRNPSRGGLFDFKTSLSSVALAHNKPSGFGYKAVLGTIEDISPPGEHSFRTFGGALNANAAIFYDRVVATEDTNYTKNVAETLARVLPIYAVQSEPLNQNSDDNTGVESTYSIYEYLLTMAEKIEHFKERYKKCAHKTKLYEVWFVRLLGKDVDRADSLFNPAMYAGIEAYVTALLDSVHAVFMNFLRIIKPRSVVLVGVIPWWKSSVYEPEFNGLLKNAKTAFLNVPYAYVSITNSAGGNVVYKAMKNNSLFVTGTSPATFVTKSQLLKAEVPTDTDINADAFAAKIASGKERPGTAHPRRIRYKREGVHAELIFGNAGLFEVLREFANIPDRLTKTGYFVHQPKNAALYNEKPPVFEDKHAVDPLGRVIDRMTAEIKAANARLLSDQLEYTHYNTRGDRVVVPVPDVLKNTIGWDELLFQKHIGNLIFWAALVRFVDADDIRYTIFSEQAPPQAPPQPTVYAQPPLYSSGSSPTDDPTFFFCYYGLEHLYSANGSFDKIRYDALRLYVTNKTASYKTRIRSAITDKPVGNDDADLMYIIDNTHFPFFSSAHNVCVLYCDAQQYVVENTPLPDMVIENLKLAELSGETSAHSNFEYRPLHTSQSGNVRSADTVTDSDVFNEIKKIDHLKPGAFPVTLLEIIVNKQLRAEFFSAATKAVIHRSLTSMCAASIRTYISHGVTRVANDCSRTYLQAHAVVNHIDAEIERVDSKTEDAGKTRAIARDLRASCINAANKMINMSRSLEYVLMLADPSSYADNKATSTKRNPEAADYNASEFIRAHCEAVGAVAATSVAAGTTTGAAKEETYVTKMKEIYAAFIKLQNMSPSAVAST